MNLVDIGRRHRLVGTAISGAANRRLLPVPRRVVRGTFPDGRVMALHLGDRTQRQMLLDRFEPIETELLRGLLQPGDDYVDVGAHVGWFVVQAAAAVAPGGRVFAFEAFRPNAQLLRHNVVLNEFDNVRVEHVAIADEPGETTIGTQANSDSGSATAGGTRARNAVQSVIQTTLDTALGADVEPRLLKIDVEGYEERVLNGGAEVLARTHAALIELNRSALQANGSDPDRIRDMLSEAGLSHQRILTAAATRVSSASIPNVLATRQR